MNGAAAVLDIGKTNVKLALFARGRRAAVGALDAQPRRCPGPPYPHADVEAIWAFLIAALRDAERGASDRAIVPTTHGCAGALVDERRPDLPVMDYEFAGVDEIEPLYAPLRPPFSQTLSPPLPVGLNLGKQIAWQKTAVSRGLRQRQALSDLSAILVVAAQRRRRLRSDDAGRAYRPLGAAQRALLHPGGGARHHAPDAAAAAAPGIGSARSSRTLAAAAGLGADVGVLCGVHDSNASLLPHLASREPPFTIVSTGTWVILMAVGLGVDHLDPADDMLANVDVEGRPVACARFMGGREYRRDRRAANRRAPTRPRWRG